MIFAVTETSGSPEEGSSGCLYVALSKEHRVSRTFRASWFLRHLNQSIDQLSEQVGDESQDINVLASRGGAEGVVTPRTNVLYLCWQYSLVFVLDLSPNMRSVSNNTYSVKVDEAVTSLSQCLTLLTQPFVIEEGGEKVEPRLCVTVFAFCGASTEQPIHVLLQGCYVCHGNCDEVLDSLHSAIKDYENFLASHTHTHTPDTPLSVSGDTSMEAMLRAGSLAIQLLPRGALKGIVLLTDGLSGFSNPASMHSMVTNMRGGNISCWVVHIGGPGHPNAPLGLVPDLETINFVCRACNGCVIYPEKLEQSLQKVQEEVMKVGVATLNVLQKAVLLWSWQTSAFNTRVKGVVGPEWAEFEDPFTPQKHQQFHSNTITAPLLGMVGCKIREGFYLDRLQVNDGRVEVILCYPWKPSVHIYYTIQAVWPLSLAPEDLKFTTSYRGPYSFVHDVLSDHTSSAITPYRLAAVRKFKQALQRFSSSDALLAHFLSFSTCPSHYSLSHSVQDGLPLFYFPPNSSKPVPSPGINTSGGKASSLHPYWRPLCTIDTSQWFRWFHSNKIVLVLYPEFPLPRNLLHMSNGRYGSPLCRPNASHLFDYLKAWSSVVLLEGHSYIRFLPYQASPPSYFCLVRVAQKHPCVVLHIGHIEGTPHILQRETAATLRAGLTQLCAGSEDRKTGSGDRKTGSGDRKTGGGDRKTGGGDRKTGGGDRKTGSGDRKTGGGGGKSVKKGSSPRVKPVLALLHKQLQRFMVRHEVTSGSTHVQPGGVAFAEPMERLTQMDYLTGYKWCWKVPLHSTDIAMALLRCRLHEGYMITNTLQGIVTLTAQLFVKQEGGVAGGNDSRSVPFLLQYVIFPYEYGDGQQAKSELWVEPQHGIIAAYPPGLQYLCGLSHAHIAGAVHKVDHAVVLQTASFVELQRECVSKATEVCVKDVGVVDSDCTVSGRGLLSHTCAIPFQLDSLLTRSSVSSVLMRAMSDGVPATGSVVTLSQCSQLNSKFWHSVHTSLQTLAVTHVPLPRPQALLQRLRASSNLQALFSLPGFESCATEVEWLCYGISEEGGNVTVLCLPQGFFHRPVPPTTPSDDHASLGDGHTSPATHTPLSCSSFSPCSSPPSTLLVDPPTQPPVPRPLWLPLLLLRLDHSHILEPVTFAPSTESLESLVSSDWCMELDLKHPATPPQDADGCGLISEVSSLHRSCYLSMLHMALISDLPLSPLDVDIGIRNCHQSGVVVDATPLLSALCPHVVTSWCGRPGTDSFSLPLLTDQLCALLSASLAKQEWSVCVQTKEQAGEEEGVGHGCGQSSSYLNRVLQIQLEKFGFQSVKMSSEGKQKDEENGGLYWLDTGRILHQEEQISNDRGVPISESSSSNPSPIHKAPVASISDQVKSMDVGGHTSTEEEEAEEKEEFELDLLVSPRNVETEMGVAEVVGVTRNIDGGVVTTPPLFLHISLSLRDDQGGVIARQYRPASAEGPLTCCFRTLLASVDRDRRPTLTNVDTGTLALWRDRAGGVVSGDEDSECDSGYTMGIDLEFSFVNVSDQGQSVLPRVYQGVVASLQSYLNWLLCDELVSVGRSMAAVTETLLQDVSAHVQNSHNSVSTCHLKMSPLKFVFGEIHSLTYFIEQLESMDLVGHTLIKEGEYYYLKPNPPSPDSAHRGNLSADLYNSDSDMCVATPGSPSSNSTHRSKTPPPPPPLLPSACLHHRRSQSTGYPMGHAPLLGHTPLPGHMTSSQMSSQSNSQQDLVEVGSGYEAGLSSASSMSEVKEEGVAGGHICVAMDAVMWIILRVLAGTVTIYFQVRHSRQLGSEVMAELYDIYEQVSGLVERTCHRTNQWFLLKDMLNTHTCSSYLLLEAGSEAWVEGHQHTRADPFRSEEFACELVHNCHITPHPRVKEMKPKAALLVTRSALSAFSVTNRKDVYVLQDVLATGEENIFYVKVYESLCSVGKGGQLDCSPVLERRDTICTVDTAETLSTVSYQPSLSEVQTDYDRRGPIAHADVTGLSLLSLQGKPQESLVLQVYGICPASRDFKDRLYGTIQRKLDATTLDILCGLYARNPQLKLTPNDVHFLQPDFRKPSMTFSVPLPEWVKDGYRSVFFYYYLQTLSTMAFYPLYTSSENREGNQFQPDMELSNTYLANNLNNDALPDHLFLYIRPQTKGRGMAVLCLTLLDPLGCTISPLPGRTVPLRCEEGACDVDLDMECAIKEHDLLTGSSSSIRMHVWEKGNIGIDEFMQRLALCYRHTLYDFFLEVYVFARAIAVLDEDDWEQSHLDVSSVASGQEGEEDRDSIADEVATGQRVGHPRFNISSVDRSTLNISFHLDSEGRGSDMASLHDGSDTPSRRGSETPSQKDSGIPRKDLDYHFRRGSETPSHVGSDFSSRRSSENPSRRNSENPFRRGSQNTFMHYPHSHRGLENPSSRRGSEDPSSRRGSENPSSRRGSENPSRRDSEHLSVFTSHNSSRRSSDSFWHAHDNPSTLMRTHAESRRASGDGDHKVLERAVSQALLSWRQDPVPEAIDEVDESLYASQTSLESPSRRGMDRDTPSRGGVDRDTPSRGGVDRDTPSRGGWDRDTPSRGGWDRDTPSRGAWDRDTPIASPIPGRLGDLGEEGKKGGVAWLAREKLRRTVNARQELEKDAELGRCGLLTSTFTEAVPLHLSQAHVLGCPSVNRFKLSLLGHYSALTALSQTVAALRAVFSDFTVTSFCKMWGGYRQIVAEKDWTKVQRSLRDVANSSSYIVLGRNDRQWDECTSSGSGLVAMDTGSELSATQLFSSLGGKFMFSATSSSLASRTPLKGAGNLKDTFVPRRRMVYATINHCQLEVWLYNVNEPGVKRIQERLQAVCEWLSARSGLLHNLLAQKMGLFKHCQGSSLAPCAKAVQKKCATMNGTVKVIKNGFVLEESVPARPGLGPAHLVHSEHLAIDAVYQQQRPYGGVANTQDPVFNHGSQFRNWYSIRRRQLDSQDLLGRVFKSWQARGDGSSIPVDTESIKSLKRMSRLLHYCTSPLLLHPPNDEPPTLAWIQGIQTEVLTLYLKYLSTLGFQTINERISTKRKGTHKSVPSSHLCKLLQRSWPEGIIMVEVLFRECDFTVRLYSLERSRLQEGVEFSSSFSKECAGYKDFIHVNSFMYDFHVNLLQQLLCGRRPLPPYQLVMSDFIAHCYRHIPSPPNFINNLLARGVVCVPSSVEPLLLYRHLITRCQEFDAVALEVGGEEGVASGHKDALVGLLIDININQSPDLTAFTYTIQNGYSVNVLALYSAHQSQADQVQYLELVFYLLLVNTNSQFPRLTSSSPHLAPSCHALPANTPSTESPETKESGLHLEVREHRRRMGLGTLATPPGSSQMVLEEELVEKQMQCMRTHLENTINNGLHHMRKDELWKRMLYGTTSLTTDSKAAVWSHLSVSDFQDLLYMVTECQLETMDPRLVQFKKQSRKWFKKLVSPLKRKFDENVREYSSDTQTYVVIINPDWQDMAVLIRVDSFRHGLSAIYRKSKEGGTVPAQERPITTHVEADRMHIETVVNFCCSFMWATILDSAPPPPILQFL